MPSGTWIVSRQSFSGRRVTSSPQGKYGMTDRVIYDPQDIEQDAELGDNYVYWVPPEDGPPIELAVVGWSKIATASKELLDAWGRGAPDDASSLTEEEDPDGA